MSTQVNPDETRRYFFWPTSLLFIFPSMATVLLKVSLYNIYHFISLHIKRKKKGKTSEIGGLISAITPFFSFSQSILVFFLADGPFSFSHFSSSNPSPSPQSSSSSSSVQSQPSTCLNQRQRVI